jgi:hypothetical protein
MEMKVCGTVIFLPLRACTVITACTVESREEWVVAFPLFYFPFFYFLLFPL